LSILANGGKGRLGARRWEIEAGSQELGDRSRISNF
jgi:hypothetical protein